MRDPLLATLLDSLSVETDGNSTFVLIDPALQPDARRWLNSRLGTVCVSLELHGAVTGEAEAVMPFLAAIPPEPHVRDRVLTQSLMWAQEAHAATWLRSDLSVQSLANELGQRMDVALAADMRVILRFSDARILRPLHDVLSDAQRAAFFSVFNAWCYLDRSEQLQALPLPPDAASHFVAPLTLSQAQEDQLLAAAEPDAVLQLLREEVGEELAAVERKRRHGFVVAQLALARIWGLESAADFARFCMVSLAQGEDFFESPQWQAALRRVQAREINMAQAMSETL